VYIRLGLLAVALACLPFNARAQTSPDDREQQNIRLKEQREQQRRVELENSKALSKEPWSRGETSKPLPPLPTRKMTEAQKLRLYPSREEKEKFVTFLRQPRTGLVRLLQSGDCQDDPRVVQVGFCMDLIPPVPGGGTFYSFASGSHQWRQLADLWLEGDLFRAGFAGSVLGVMTSLGDLPLENVKPESPGVNYLSTLAPPGSMAEARKQYLRNAAGFRVSGHKYGLSAPVSQGNTYVLRSTTYKFGDDLDKQRKLDDVLIAFRVVGTTADGSVTLLWKELRRQKTPKIKT
jgi:hypothetical protein